MNGIDVESRINTNNGDSLEFKVDDLEFCTTCGTILPLPTPDECLMCRLCKKTIQINGKSHLIFSFLKPVFIYKMN